MNGIALPVIQLGDKVINLINLCYWEEVLAAGGAKLIEIVYPGPTRCCLNAAESDAFRAYLAKAQQASRSSIVPATNLPSFGY